MHGSQIFVSVFAANVTVAVRDVKFTQLALQPLVDQDAPVDQLIPADVSLPDNVTLWLANNCACADDWEHKGSSRKYFFLLGQKKAVKTVLFRKGENPMHRYYFLNGFQDAIITEDVFRNLKNRRALKNRRKCNYFKVLYARKPSRPVY